MRFQHSALIVQLLAGVKVIEVDDHGVLLHIRDKAIEPHSLFVHQRDDIAGIDDVGSKLAVHYEILLSEFDDAVRVIRSVGLIHREGEVKLVALLQIAHARLETIESHAHIRDELEGVLLRGLFYQFMNASLIVGIEVVRYGDVAVCHVK